MELTEVQKEADSAGRKAIAFGLFALFVAGAFGWTLAHLASTGPATQPVVVAVTDIAPLTQLRTEQLKVVEWPTDSMPHGTFQKVEDVVHTNKININGILASEPVLDERLSTPDRGLGMSQMVEPNMRAYVIQVDGQVATAEIMHPGANVDVVVTLEDPKYHEPVTKLILQNVQILGVGDSIDVERSMPRSKDEQGVNHDVVERHRVVTLLVHLADLEVLSFAARNGKLDLTLRNNNDVAVAATTKGVTFDKIMGRNRDGSPINPKAAADGQAAAGGGMGGAQGGQEAAPMHHNHGRSHDQGPSIIKVKH